MKNALTMFKELGFKLYYSSDNYLLYNYETDYDQVFVGFDLEPKTYDITWSRFVDNNESVFVPMNERPQNIKHSSKYGYWQRDPCYKVNIALHNAIHQQMIELGWIE